MKKKSVLEKTKKMISSLKGKVGKVDDWGELDLAYSIAGNDTGIFLLFNLELEAEAAKEIDSKLNLEEGIVRYLLVRKE